MKTFGNEIKQLWQDDHRFVFRILGWTVLIGIGVLIGHMIYGSPEADQAWGYGVNLFTGVLTTAATVLIVDQLSERRANRRAEEALKQQLVDDAASLSNEIAKNATHQLRRKQWIEGDEGLLKGADLNGANLEGAILREASLQGADLRGANLQRAGLGMAKLQGTRWFEANLQGADLSGANLQGAGLVSVKLQGADLSGANLQEAGLVWVNMEGARLGGANLRGADLVWANLQGVYLVGANLQGADLTRAEFDNLTILPDENAWMPDTNMEKFTNPEHADFWRSEDRRSPAYRGDSENKI